MGESAVLAHSYSFAAPITRTDSHEDHTNHALSQSISFGKFMTENLEWGKWSTFSHKKYVEEAEKYSRPGSVAQKKAFFEAHYKRIAEAKKAATEEQPTVTPAEVLLQALETQPPLSLLPEEESTTERKSIQNDDVLAGAVDDEMEEEMENGLVDECDDKEQDEELLKEEKTRRSMTKNRPVFRLSLEKTIPPPKPIDTRTEIATTPEKTSERPITQISGKTEEKPVHRKKFSFFNCFRGGAKTRDQNHSRKKGKRETKKQKKQFLCLCFKPKTVRRES
ncbi:hypothetical protein Bca4012_052397 [Brassica carinata]|uniref:TPX2 C-terminal domain-containing protein n=2 Tax=Brassica TaxID=3705 RepID=A0A0D3AW68_BRAOL|nr:PREDICTED: uncharacterized protein LOC106324713 [Brassica oleracea var. oleracea]KAG2242198.1 hypothetical protein Bca52824_095954 [Brassica carinata]